MLALKGVADAHKAQFYLMVASIGETVLVRQPAPVVATGSSAAAADATKALGARPVPAAPVVPGPILPIPAIVSGASTIAPLRPGAPSPAAPVGLVADSDLILRVRLEDVLLDASKPFGRTVFETAIDVEVRGSRFKLVGVERGGLAPVGPYILWVGLRATGA